MSSSALSVRNLCFSYRDGFSLENVSFKLDEGSLCALIGPNGSGKTTLLRCISGLLSGVSGEIRVLGRRIEELGDEIHKLISYVPPELDLGIDLKVFDLVAIGRKPRIKGFWESDDDLRVIERIMEELDVKYLSERFFSTLSSGEKQRVLIAQALAKEPRILLLDEPFSHLDLRYRFEIFDMLVDLAGKGLTIIFSTHDLSIPLGICDKVIVISKGRILAKGDPKIVLTERVLREAYDMSCKIEWMEDIPVIVPSRP